jgi:hypothetical protein
MGVDRAYDVPGGATRIMYLWHAQAMVASHPICLYTCAAWYKDDIEGKVDKVWEEKLDQPAPLSLEPVKHREKLPNPAPAICQFPTVSSAWDDSFQTGQTQRLSLLTSQTEYVHIQK